MAILIAIITISVLVLLHEMGHFFIARAFNIKVEEFGIGMPPRLFGKKWGETIYSVNALPIGGFVRMEGEEKRVESERSFSEKAVWKRFFIVAGGVLVFWVISAAIFTVLGVTTGIPMAVNDNDTQGIENPHVRIIGVLPNSPAANAGIKLGDTILRIGEEDITRIQRMQELSKASEGKEVELTIQRGDEIFPVTLTPRVNAPVDEGAMGVMLARAGLVKYIWYEAPFRGVAQTWNLTTTILKTFWTLGSNLLRGEGLPPGTQFSGPVGVVGLLSNSFSLGISSFLSFVAVISVYLAIFNSLPIPALDGGRMFFLVIEGIRRKPLSEKFEQRLIMISFLVLIPLIIWVTVGDIRRLF